MEEREADLTFFASEDVANLLLKALEARESAGFLVLGEAREGCGGSRKRGSPVFMIKNCEKGVPDVILLETRMPIGVRSVRKTRSYHRKE